MKNIRSTSRRRQKWGAVAWSRWCPPKAADNQATAAPSMSEAPIMNAKMTAPRRARAMRRAFPLKST
jgi:hypothetical protein